MTRIRPLEPDEIPAEIEHVIEARRASFGFLPNSMRIMAHRPEIAAGFHALQSATRGGTLDPGLNRLISLMTSAVTGCRYCQAHNAFGGHRSGVEDAKIAAIWEFETSEMFTVAERAALRVARDAAGIPNSVSDEHFIALAEHFDDGEIVEIVAAIAMMKFLNTFNETFATELEDEPIAYASQHLHGLDWEPGRHAQ